MSIYHVQRIYDVGLGQYVRYESIIPTASPNPATTVPVGIGPFTAPTHEVLFRYEKFTQDNLGTLPVQTPITPVVGDVPAWDGAQFSPTAVSGVAASTVIFESDGTTLTGLDALSFYGAAFGTNAKVLGSAPYGNNAVVAGDEVNTAWNGTGLADGDSFSICLDQGDTYLIPLSKYYTNLTSVRDRINAIVPGSPASVLSYPSAAGYTVEKLRIQGAVPFTGSVSLCNVSGATLQKLGLEEGIWLSSGAEATVADELYVDVDLGAGGGALLTSSEFFTMDFTTEELGIDVMGQGPVNVALTGTMTVQDIVDAINAENIDGLYCSVTRTSNNGFKIALSTVAVGTTATLDLTDAVGSPIAMLGFGTSATGSSRGVVAITTTALASDIIDDINTAIGGNAASAFADGTALVRSARVGATSSVRVSDLEPATGTLVATANFAAAETVTVGGQTYTFRAALIGANDVLIGATALESLANLSAAINLGTGSGTLYHASTAFNTQVMASATVGTYATSFLKGINAAFQLSIGDTVDIEGQTYTFKDVLSVANDVARGGWVGDALSNLNAAINAGPGAGTAYHVGTVANAYVSSTISPNREITVTAKAAYAGLAGNAIDTTAVTDYILTWGASKLKGGSDSLVVTAKVKGIAGNSIASTETCANASWGGATLSGAIGDPATGTLTISPNVVATDTVTPEGKTYTFVAAAPTADGEVLVGATIADSTTNLAAAINLGAGAGTLYAAATTAHPRIYAVANPGAGTITAVALAPGVGGNEIDTSATGGNATWGAAQLSGGTGGSLGIPAAGSLRATANFANGETVVAAKVYTFQSVLTNVDGNVAIGASLAESLDNLTNAINLGAGAGTGYAAAMTANPQVSAQSLSILATGTLTDTVDFSAGHTVTLGSQTYTMVTPFVDVAGNVLIDGTLAGSLANLAAAINAGAGAGSVYGTGTAINAAATAVAVSDVLTATAKDTAAYRGTYGNAVATTTGGGATAAWSAATLTGGTTYGMDVFALVAGDTRNTISLYDTAANAAWTAATALGGRGGAPLQTLSMSSANQVGVDQDPTVSVVTDPNLGSFIQIDVPGALYGTLLLLVTGPVPTQPMKLESSMGIQYPGVTDGLVSTGIVFCLDPTAYTSYSADLMQGATGPLSLRLDRSNGVPPTPAEGYEVGVPTIAYGGITVNLTDAKLDGVGHPAFAGTVTHTPVAGTLTTAAISTSYPLPRGPVAWDTATSNRVGLVFSATTRDPVKINVTKIAVTTNP